MLLPLRPEFPVPSSPVTACLFYNGVLYVGGFFRDVQGTPRYGLAAFDPVTYELLPWDPNINIGFSTIEVLYQVGGKIFVGGSGITSVNGGAHTVYNLFAVDPVTGAYDTGFGSPQLNNNVLDMVSDGTTLFFVGGFTTVNASNRQSAAACDVATGALTAWDPSLNGAANAVDYFPPTSTVYIGGFFTTVNLTSSPVGSLFGANFNSTTGAYGGWNPGTNAPITALDIDLTSNLVYIGGHFTTMAFTESRQRIGALPTSPLTPHTPIPPFNPSSVTQINFFKFFDGQIYIGNFSGPLGFGLNPSKNSDPYGFAIFFPDGTVDQSQRYDLGGPVLDMAKFGADSGNIPKTLYMCGFFSSFYGYQYQHAIAKYTKGGHWVSSWTPFITNDADWVDTIFADDVNRRVYIIGSFTSVTGPNGVFARSGLAALDMDTGDVLPWAPILNNTIGFTGGDMLYHNGVLYIVKQFSQATGLNGTFTRNNAVAIDLAGNILPWDPNLTVGPPAYGTSLATDGTYIYIGGTFLTVNGGTARSALARFDLVNGTVDLTWDPQLSDTFSPSFLNVRDLAIDLANGWIYVGGRFTNAGGAAGKTGLARLDLVTGADTGWNAQATLFSSEPEIFTIFKRDGVIRFFGNFDTLNAQSIIRIGILDDAGNVLAGDYDPGNLADDSEPFSDVWILGFGSLFNGLPGVPRTQGFSIFDYGNNLNPVATGLDNDARSISGADDTYLFIAGQFIRTGAVLLPFSGGSAFFQAGTVGVPRKPVVEYLLRKRDTTIFRWKPVTQDVLGRQIEPNGYKVYRSNNQNLETFDLIATVSSLDIRGVLDTMFSEDIPGFYAYGVTAFNGQGESEMAVAEAVRSVMDSDLFG